MVEQVVQPSSVLCYVNRAHVQVGVAHRPAAPLDGNQKSGLVVGYDVGRHLLAVADIGDGKLRHTTLRTQPIPQHGRRVYVANVGHVPAQALQSVADGDCPRRAVGFVLARRQNIKPGDDHHVTGIVHDEAGSASAEIGGKVLPQF